MKRCMVVLLLTVGLHFLLLEPKIKFI
jgi:hypothetical protein